MPALWQEAPVLMLPPCQVPDPELSHLTYNYWARWVTASVVITALCPIPIPSRHGWEWNDDITNNVFFLPNQVNPRSFLKIICVTLWSCQVSLEIVYLYCSRIKCLYACTDW